MKENNWISYIWTTWRSLGTAEKWTVFSLVTSAWLCYLMMMQFCWLNQTVTSSMYKAGLQSSIKCKDVGQHLQVWGHGPPLLSCKFTSEGQRKREADRQITLFSILMQPLQCHSEEKAEKVPVEIQKGSDQKSDFADTGRQQKGLCSPTRTGWGVRTSRGRVGVFCFFTMWALNIYTMLQTLAE